MTLLALRHGSRYVVRGIAAVLFCALLPSAFGQAEKGTLSGVVTDSSGAVVAGATVTATNIGTNSARVIQTDSSGNYTISNLPPGAYSLNASAAGFGNVVQKVELAPGGRVAVDVRLAAAGNDTSVEVSAVAETQVETQSSALSEVVSAKRIAELPSLTRDPYDFVQTLGNVALDSGSGTGGQDQVFRGAGVSVNGQRSASVDALLDGGENVDLFTTKVGQSVPLDAVQEFSLISNNFSAEYGRASGGVLNVVTKSGTNEFHGSLYEFNRISNLSSNDYESNANGIPRAHFTRNQFGYAFGGPIKKNKLFFFSSTEWTRVRSAANAITLVMDPAFLAASAPNTKSFFANQKLRPGLTVLQTEGATDAGFQVDPLKEPNLFAYGPNAPIFDKVSYTAPADSGGGAPQNTYNSLDRVDFRPSDSTQMFFRYAIFSQDEFAGFVNSSPYQGFDTGQTNFNNNFMYSLTRVWTPRVVTDTKLLFNRLNLTQPLSSAQPVQPTLFFNPAIPVGVNGDLISLPGYTQLSPGQSIPFGGPQNVTEISHSVSWNKGVHDFRLGGQYVYTRDNRTFGAYENAVEALNGKGGTTDSLENFLTGTAGWFQVVVDPQGKFPCQADPINIGQFIQTPACTVTLPTTQPSFSRSNRYNDFALYGQDTWRVVPRLTLNLGLRWEYYGVQHNKDPRLDSNFVFTQGGNYFDNFRNGQVFTVTPTANSPASPVGGLWQPQYHNFAPRVGFAWDVLGDGSTSLRGGYGIAYERNFGNITFNVIQNPPAQFNVIFNNGVPITTENLGPFAGAGSIPLPPASLRYVRQNIPTAYANMWNLSLERQVMRNSLVALEYSGSHGVHLYSIENTNQAGTGIVYMGEDPDVFSPLDRINRQYGNMNTRETNGFSYYNSLNTRFVSSDLLHQGIDITVNYTYSHAIDNISSTFSENPQTEGFLGLLDPFNPALDKGNADFDARHHIALSAVWTLPYAKRTHGFAKQVLDGWSLAPILSARTGQPFTVFDSNGFVGTDTVASRYIPSAPFQLSGTTSTSTTLGTPNTFAYLNLPGSNTYTDPLVGSGELPTCDMVTNAAGHLVSTGQNCHFPADMTHRNAFRGAGYYNIDLSAGKELNVTERFRLQFRGEFYNLLNHSNYYVQSGLADAGFFGTDKPFAIIGKKGVNPAGGIPNDRRFVQMALKLTF